MRSIERKPGITSSVSDPVHIDDLTQREVQRSTLKALLYLVQLTEKAYEIDTHELDRTFIEELENDTTGTT